MTKIYLGLPGEPRTTVLEPAEGYVITVTRSDGFACNEIEAQVALSLASFTPKPERKTKGKQHA